MEQPSENNKANEDAHEEYEFKYDFITMPWDDRTRNSKIGIVALLTTIFVVVMACVINSVAIHYRGFRVGRELFNCPIVKMEDYEYVARIVSIGTGDLLCVGALVSKSSVLVSRLCIKSGPVRLHLGHPTHPVCRKGFSVDIIEALPRYGNESEQKLLLLTSRENIMDCAKLVDIGHSLGEKNQVFVIGRAYFSEKFLLFRPAKIVKVEECFESSNVQGLTQTQRDVICVLDVHSCPVREGDLLIHNNKLYGIATNSTNNNDDNFVSFTRVGILNFK